MATPKPRMEPPEPVGGRHFVYHRVPPQMRGTVLYPLGRLEVIHPDLVASHLTRYVGREDKLLQLIPPLGCRWRDVLNLTPIHPGAVRAAMRDAGHLRFPRRWFEIDAARFTPDDTILYLPGSNPAEARFVPWEPGRLTRYAQVSEVQRQFYRRVEPGQPVLLFGGTPHVLYRGEIDVRAVRVIEA